MSGLRAHGLHTDRFRFIELLDRLGNPHLRYPCVHVAGTNGKGSTTTFIASTLSQAGYRVGAYLSPYVFDLRERVQVNAGLISREDFARHVSAIRPHIEALARSEYGQTSEFELKTAIAFRHFAQTAVDFAVIEVGIGGRLDATNVIPPPLVAVITQIGWDHMHLLGDTLGKIAFEKAGIFKPGTIGVTTVALPEPLAVIQAVARERGIALHRVCSAGAPDSSTARVTFRRDSAGLVHLTLPGGVLAPLRLSLRAAYQAENAATAAAALDVLRTERGVAISDDTLRAGLEQAALPGRFQILRPYPGGPTVVLDGAHNEDGAAILAEALVAEFGAGRRYLLVLGTSRGHAPGPFLRVLAPLTRSVIATQPEFKPTLATDVAQVARDLGLPARVVTPVAAALRQTVQESGPEDVIVVTGSFYVVGETPEELRVKA